MGRYWMRAIDSAQRRITIEKPESTLASLKRVTFEIQGLLAEFENGSGQLFPYTDMVDQGSRLEGEKPLSVVQRIFRREAKIGEIQTQREGLTRMVLWTKPPLDLIFDLTEEEGLSLWRECEIMVRSAGFHFRLETSESPE